MYSHRTGLTLGFHGCDRSVAQSVFKGESELKTSMNSYDWLGHGIYFWEYSPKRAMDFANSVRGVFFEGPDLYLNSGFKEKDHIQICIRNPNCIKGYFLPRVYDKHFSRV
jgi:hypothetical protein